MRHPFFVRTLVLVRLLPVGVTYRGPATEAIPYIAPITPIYAGLPCRGTVCPTIKMAPEKRPAEPIPAIARPRIRPVELGVMPQTNEPSSKMKSAPR